MSETSSSFENNPMHEFMDEIDKALKLPRSGDIVTGEVIQVTDKYVIVNLGCKKDGIIPRNEVSLEPEQNLQDLFNEGDEVQAKVLKNDDGDGNILLSKKRAVVSEHWADVNEALENKETLEVKVVKEVNGGVIAVFNEINGFIPMSQLSDRYIEKADEFVGQTMTVKVMRVDQKRNKVVFSHKAVLSEERAQRMLEIWDTINVGDIIDGKVMRFTEYGAFVDIGGIDGLLHISEISWGKLRHPEEVLAIDQEIQVKVLSMNKEKEKISLGYKQNLPEPWSVINDKYQIGQIISGKAVQLKEYGVFVELEPGLDGLVHISEIAYKRVNNISDEIEVGQDITAKILEIDKDRRRISLSIKETLEKPEIEEQSEEAAEAVAKKPDRPAPPAMSSEGAHDGITIGDKLKEALSEAADAADEKSDEITEEAAAPPEEFEQAVTEAEESPEEKAEELEEVADEPEEAAPEEAVEETEEPIDEPEEVAAEQPEETEEVTEEQEVTEEAAPEAEVAEEAAPEAEVTEEESV